MSVFGYLLTLDACPNAFATAGCPSTITLPPGFAAPVFDWSGQWSIEVGLLEWPDFTIDEKLALSDGQLSVGGGDFVIHAGQTLSGGPYAGELALRLFTTKASRIAQSALAADYAAGDATLTLASTAGFPSGDQVVWTEQEALRVTRSGSTLTVRATVPYGWGYYGSRDEDHVRSAARGYSPIVWGAYPGAKGRRCTLWEVTAEGYATAIWRGRVVNAHPTEDGGDYVLSCSHVWDAIKDTKPGGAGATLTLGGWWLRGVDSVVGNGRVGALVARVSGTPGGAESKPADDEGERVCATLEELAAVVQARLQVDLIAVGYTATFATVTLDDTGGLILSVAGPSTELTSASLATFGGLEGETVLSADNTVSGGVRTCTARVAAEKVPGAYIPTRDRAAIVATVVLDTTLGFPSSFTRETVTSTPGLVTYETVLMGELDDPQLGERFLLAFRPTSINADESTAVGTFEYVPKTRTTQALRGLSPIDLSRRQTLKLVSCVTADHWSLAIDYALTSWSTARRASVDSRDWARDLSRAVIAATDGTPELARARWYLDGERSFGELVSAQCRLNGCAVGVRGSGCLGLIPLRPPLPTDDFAAVFTSADYVGDFTPGYELSDESVRTSAQFKSGNLTVQVTDLDAEARYGATAPLELEAVGAVEGLSQETATPDLVAGQLLRYVLGAWSGPVSVHTLPVSFDRFSQSVFLGDAVQFDSFNAPDGAGGYGLVAQRGLVIARNGSLEGDDVLQLSVAVFEDAERNAAIAPALRVASIAGAVLTIATAYLTGSATDYAGSNAAGYRYSPDDANDGGVSWVTAGTRWRLVTLDALVELAQGGLVVASASPGAGTVTLTASVSTGVQDWTAYLTGGGLAVLIFDGYASTGSGEHAFAHVGSESANVINGTTDAPNTWAP